MKLTESIQVLKNHNKWRRGEDDTLEMTDPKKLGIAIDTVVNEFENLFISGVVKSFYCQSDIEMNGICDKQCNHCEEYYKPLEQ